MARGRRKKDVVQEPTGPPRVLVVNDEEGASELLKRLLATASYEVDAVPSHDAAMRALSGDDKPDCIVLDLATGGIGQNLKLLDAVRNHVDDTVATARVLLVAHQTNNRLFSWQAGIDAFLLRPFHADELLREVAEVLARPDDERERHRRQQLDAASGEGRTVDARPWDTQRF